MLFESEGSTKRKREPCSTEPEAKRAKAALPDIDEQLQRELNELYATAEENLASIDIETPQTNIPSRNHHQSHTRIPELGKGRGADINFKGRISNEQNKLAEVEDSVKEAPEDYEPIVRIPKLVAPLSPKLDLWSDEAESSKPPLQISTPTAPEPAEVKPFPPQIQQAQMMQYYQMQMMQQQMMQNPAYQAQMMQYMKVQQAQMMQRRQLAMQHAMLAKQRQQESLAVTVPSEELFEPPNMKGLFKGL